MSKLTDELDLDGAPEPIINRFKDAEPVFNGESYRLIEEYRNDVLNPDVNAESAFEDLIE